MKKGMQARRVTYTLNVILIALVVICFLFSMTAVRNYAREDCFNRIEEETAQVAQMFAHSLEESLNKLTVFAGILGANSENPDELLQAYMEHFCQTQYFSAVCIHRPSGRTTSYGDHPHELFADLDFETEVNRVPYVSEAVIGGMQPEESVFYQAVPIIRSGKTVGILYGYITLDVLPQFISSSAYDGKAQFYVVDGNTGHFLMDEYHGTLGNIYDGSMGEREAMRGYSMDEMLSGIQHGSKGFFVFKSLRTGEWYYTYYMPLGINNWSMQITIDEPTAFVVYAYVNTLVLTLMMIVVVLLLSHLLVLMVQHRSATRLDKRRLHRSSYINAVQSALITAHSNPDFVDRALKLIAEEMKAETTLLLSFSGQTITSAQHWPGQDSEQARNLVGRNALTDFAVLYKRLSANQSVVYDQSAPSLQLSDTAAAIFQATDVRNLALVPIMAPSGELKGALAAVNLAQIKQGCEMLECVAFDFFMALINLENHTIIKRMGIMDSLTQLKNRNCFEAEVSSYTEKNCDSLWCVFIDVNGLHEINNMQGHKAGDMMLCTVAQTIRHTFGEQYAYRFGGDEFVAFAIDSSHEMLMNQKDSITSELVKQGYYVSIGFKQAERKADGTFDVERMVAEAEIMMYDEKTTFYESNSLPTGRGKLRDTLIFAQSSRRAAANENIPD